MSNTEREQYFQAMGLISALLSLRLRLQRDQRPDWTKLPSHLLSHTLSFTSPRDACRAAAVSKAFRSAAEVNTLWDRFLPPDLEDILSRALNPVAASSRKELYFRLCDSILVRRDSADEDPLQLVFSLERSSGKKCYIISARTLSITWSDNPEYWSWASHPESRFDKVAKLLEVYWLHIHGHISCKMLSMETMYAAYLIFKLVEKRTEGLAFPSQEVSVHVGEACITRSAVCLDNSQGELASDVLRIPSEREDTWKEIEMGEFFNDARDERKVSMILQQTITMNKKSGLIIEGIEIRPRKYT